MTRIDDQLTSWDIEQLSSMIPGNQRAGMIVKTKRGLLGRTYSNEVMVSGKLRVYTSQGNFLCIPKTLTIKGYVD